MLSKKSEKFIENLRLYLISSGKKDSEIEELIDELKDHLQEAEKNGRSIDDIIDGTPEEYMTSLKKEMKTDYNNLLKTLPIYFFGFFAYMLMGPAIRGDFELNYIQVIGLPVITLLGFLYMSYSSNEQEKKQYSNLRFFVLAMFSYIIVTVLLILTLIGGKLLADPFFIGNTTSDIIVIAICTCILIAVAIGAKSWFLIWIPAVMVIPDILARFEDLSIAKIISTYIGSIILVNGVIIASLLVKERRKKAIG